MSNRHLQIAFGTLLAVASFCALPSGGAAAQDLEEFKTQMGEAAALSKTDLDGALRRYLEIRVRYAGPQVDYAVGRIYQRLGQCHEAQRYFTDVMSSYNLRENDPILQRAMKDFDSVAECQSWQAVRLDCSMPPNGYITVDGERINTCGGRVVYLADGEHTLVMHGPDLKGPYVQKLTVKSGEPEKHVQFDFPEEMLRLERKVEVVKNYKEIPAFSPHLGWGLVAGGLAVAAGGVVAGLFGQSELKKMNDYWIDYAYEKDADEKDWLESLARKAHDNYGTDKIIMYAMVGAGGAAVVTGVTFLILGAVLDKRYVEIEGDGPRAYMAPSDGGVSAGFAMSF